MGIVMTIHWKTAFQLAPVFAVASVAPNAFPAALSGIASLKELAIYAVLPATVLLLILALVSRPLGAPMIAQVIVRGAVAGAVATVGLELIRYPGFLMGMMPGNLPELMGVLLLDQFASGPSMASSAAGFAYHFLNGACFGILFAGIAAIGLVKETLPYTVGYGILIGIGFMISPVVESLGVGFFGIQFGWQFAATVTAAHACFGAVLAPMFRLLRPVPSHQQADWVLSNAAAPQSH